MACKTKSLDTNIDDLFFVDSTCINCDACRRVCPTHFEDVGEYSSFVKKIENQQEFNHAFMALQTCPTNSIGMNKTSPYLSLAKDLFPYHLRDGIYLNGFTSKKSYGAESYFIKSSKGYMVDCPRFNLSLAKRLEKMGGVDYIFLTHRDDVADVAKYREYFGAKVIIHQKDLSAFALADIVLSQTKVAEIPCDFEDMKIYYQPGHTEGHLVFLYKDQHLFSGDHLACSRTSNQLIAFDRHCWFDWETQLESLKLLLSFKGPIHLYPGHGRRGSFGPGEFEQSLSSLLASYIDS